MDRPPEEPAQQTAGTEFRAPAPPAAAAGAGPAKEERKKVPLQPGHTLNDWLRLMGSGQNLSGVTGGPRGVTLDELRKHKTVDTGIWTAIHGKVYNVTAYLEYHPGGVDELMKAAGKDGSSLFNKKHPWVNIDAFLKNCFVGVLVQ